MRKTFIRNIAASKQKGGNRVITPECVRKDLRDIRYYYSRKTELDAAAKELGALTVKRTAEKYNCAIREAPLILYDLYSCLYIRGQTQEAVAIELGYTPQYIRKLVNRLFTYFQKNIS